MLAVKCITYLLLYKLRRDRRNILDSRRVLRCQSSYYTCTIAIQRGESLQIRLVIRVSNRSSHSRMWSCYLNASSSTRVATSDCRDYRWCGRHCSSETVGQNDLTCRVIAELRAWSLFARSPPSSLGLIFRQKFHEQVGDR